MALTEFQDDVLGTLRWDEMSQVWIGQVVLLPGTATRLAVEFDLPDPSDADKVAAIQVAKATFKALGVRQEEELRRQAATRVIANAWSQAESAPPPGEAEKLYQEMELIGISLASWEEGLGDFTYRIREGSVQVVFKAGMVLDEVMVYWQQ